MLVYACVPSFINFYPRIFLDVFFLCFELMFYSNFSGLEIIEINICEG